MAIEITSGTAYEAIGFSKEEAAVRVMRVLIAAEIKKFVEKKGFTQTKAATFFGVSQPRISNILNGRVGDYTIDYLVRMASKAGRTPRVSFSGHKASRTNRVRRVEQREAMASARA